MSDSSTQAGPVRETGGVAVFWVYENWTHDRARIHRASCGYCNDGEGMHAVTGNENGHWLPFDSYYDARASVAMRRPDAGDCRACNPSR